MSIALFCGAQRPLDRDLRIAELGVVEDARLFGLLDVGVLMSDKVLKRRVKNGTAPDSTTAPSARWICNSIYQSSLAGRVTLVAELWNIHVTRARVTS
jgi:hypothetical protein